MIDNNLLERKLKSKCADKGITLVDMCTGLKINYSKLRRKLNGKKWDFETLFKVTQYVGSDIKEFMLKEES